MTKEKMMSFMTIASIALLGSGVVCANDVADPVAGTTDAVVVPVSPQPTTPIEHTGTDTTNKIVDSTKPSKEKTEEPVKSNDSEVIPEQPKSEEVKKAEENTGASTTETPKPVTKPVIETPIVTNTGYTVLGTQDGNVWVQTETGNVLKPAIAIGAVKQKDGTVALKTRDGKLEVLPSTGETKTILAILGGLAILGAIWVGWKENIKKYLTFLKKKSKK
ncbi:TPA: LPXTG cell wall anchor domain-containing protein [Streptococcus pyogenes NGAS302]|nr:LPXTG cell wall anchor domain-containing protein [Streptococcus pyogenes]HER4724532.1 LPXTG cell wall anchor domain-containing protein [Streptococcus pyogenes NGAS302]